MNYSKKMKAYKMKSRGLPKLKFKIMNQVLKSEMPLDLSIEKSRESSLFRPYIDCNSSYMIKSHQVRSTLASNQLMINDLMMKSLAAYSPFIYKMSSSLSLSYHASPIAYPSSNLGLLHQSAKLHESDAPNPTYSAFLSIANDSPFASQRSPSPSHSPTSTMCSNLSSGLSVNSSTNSFNSVDFGHKPLNRPTAHQPMNLCTRELLSDGSLNKPIKSRSELAKPVKLHREIKENERLKKTGDDQILIKCPSCWQLFDQENSLRKHIKSKHQINENSAFDRIHKCEHCVLAFTRFDMLQRHNRKHSGEKPYECNLCYRNFSRSDHLK